MALIYAHYRKTTNEIFYIGIGKTKKRSFSKCGRNKHWKGIVKRDGFESFVICENLTWEQACEAEIFLISFYGRRDLGTGPLVNLTDGGEGTVGLKQSKEVIQKRVDKLCIPVLQYSINGEFIREWSSLNGAALSLNLSGNAISKCCKNKKGAKSAGNFIWKYKSDISEEKPVYVNNSHSPETIFKRINTDGYKNRKLDTSHLKTPEAKRNRILNIDFSYLKTKESIEQRVSKVRVVVLQYSTSGDFIMEWDSAANAGRYLGFDNSSIIKCCKGKKPSAGGFIWTYKENDEFPKIISPLTSKIITKPVLQYSITDIFIKEWKYASEAANALGLHKSHIRGCCTGISKTTGGFKWKYK